MLQIPTLKELYDDIVSDIESELSVSIPVLGPSFVRAFAAVQAAKLKLAYLTLGFIQKNVAPDTADPVASGGTLERWGMIKLGRLPFSATAGEYDIQVTGEIGAIIPANTTWKSNDDSLNPGAMYILDEEFEFTTETEEITVRALTTGSAGQLNDADLMTATSPIPLVQKQAVVVNEIVAPLDAETVEEYRQKVVDSFQLEPQGGAATDLRLWASDAQGVAQTYPYAKSGAPGEVVVYVEATPEDSTDGKGTPTPTILADVESFINLNPDESIDISERGRRPITMVIENNILAITPLDVDIEIVNYRNLTATIENTLELELEEMVQAVRPFVDGIEVLANKNNIISYNTIVARILTSYPGSVFDDIILTVAGVELETYTFIDGNIPYFNSITFS
jgi:uncharacterized phage protein gp47/JayE